VSAPMQATEGSPVPIGIDFGTSKCVLTWLNPQTNQAEIIRNAEGEEETPSVVYFGDHETLVGTPALNMLEDTHERRRVVVSAKRDIAKPSLYPIPGRPVSPVDVATEIFRKLREDAEKGVPNQPASMRPNHCLFARFGVV
jgi:molecular chaperone DnaK